MSRGNRYVTPMSVPVSPVLMNAEQKVAERAATRRSHAERERQSAPVGRAVHGREHDLGRGADVLREVGHERLTGGTGRCVWVLARRRWRPEVAQVEAGAEPATRAGEHRDLAGLVGADLVERVVEIRDELERDRVQAVGSSEPDDPNRVTDPFDFDVGHRQSFRGRQEMAAKSTCPVVMAAVKPASTSRFTPFT